MNDDKLLHKWMTGTISEEELKQFKLRPEYDSLAEIKKNTAHLSVPDFDEDGMLAEILKKKKIAPTPQKGRRVFLSKWIKLGIAASLLLLATFFFFPKEKMVNYEIAQGQKLEGALPDGSTFVLNAESQLNYLGKNWQDNRTLHLKGEAFFKVKKGSNFKVETTNGTVQVLGTEFNVWSRGKTIEVTCKSGKVAVLSTDGKVLEELNPKDAVRIVANKISKKWETENTNAVTWMDGIFRFKQVSLEVVLEELERQFEIKINRKNINTKEIITCNFQNKDLVAALKTTVSTLGIRYEIGEENTVVLSK